MFATLFLSGLLLAPANPEVNPADRAQQLVAQLGDPSFRVRERAAKDILTLGGAALDALRQGLGNPDPEVAERCRKLIPQALDLRVQQEIDQFLNKPDGPIPKDLPGIARWIKIAGGAKESRQLYAQMVRDHRKLLIELEQEPAKASTRFRAFIQEVYSRTRSATSVEARKEIATFSEVVLFFFLSADPVIKKDMTTSATGTSYIQVNAILNSSHVSTMLSGAGASNASRALFLAWLEQEKNVTLIRRGFILAGQANLKEAAPMAIRAAKDKTAAAFSRSYALMAAVNLFGKEHLKELAELMEDQTQIGKTTVNGAVAAAEIRDIALGIAVQATGQKMADYGFERFRVPNPSTGTTSYIYYSLTDKQREDAFKKWKDWLAQQPK